MKRLTLELGLSSLYKYVYLEQPSWYWDEVSWEGDVGKTNLSFLFDLLYANCVRFC